MSDTRPSPPRGRRRNSGLAAFTAAAAVIAGLLIAAHTAQQQAMAREAAVLPRPSSAAPSPPPPPPAASPSAPHGATEVVGVAAAPLSVRYSFDGGARQPVLDGSAGHPLTVDAANGGAITYVAHGGGWAVQFPRRCTAAPESCPRTILQGTRDDALNPGLRPLRYGASVLMTTSDTGGGANVVQKGYSVGGVTQFKLQVDGKAGRPSCVIASATRIYRILGPTSVADGAWHNIVCARTGGTLAMTVDGIASGTRSVPRTLSIANPEPLRVGGKGTTANNDQFAGQIDNVFVNIA